MGVDLPVINCCILLHFVALQDLGAEGVGFGDGVGAGGHGRSPFLVDALEASIWGDPNMLRTEMQGNFWCLSGRR